MALTRPLLEIVRALCVLGLIFLNFGHAVVAAPVVGDVLSVAADTSFCGDPLDDQSHHGACHACRIGGGADLPPACPEIVPPMVAAEAIGPVRVETLPGQPILGPPGARAPPAV